MLKGYPGKYIKNKNISIKHIKLSKNDYLFHAGTKFNDNNLVNSGGRVLNITSTGKNFLKI